MKHIVFPGIILYLFIAGCATKKDTAGMNTSEQQILPSGEHNSRNSLDWEGTYRGILPCADCPGIRTELVLKADGSYKLSRQYQGKSLEIFISEGRFEWDGAGNVIELKDAESDTFKVGENQLIQLDKTGHPIEGNLSEAYVLGKNKAAQTIENSYWKLTERRGKPSSFQSPSGKAPYFILIPEGGKAMGFSGCNRFSGSYETAAGNRLRFIGMASTKMACPQPNPEQEFLEALSITDNYSLNGDTLYLNKARMAPLARLTRSFFE